MWNDSKTNTIPGYRFALEPFVWRIGALGAKKARWVQHRAFVLSFLPYWHRNYNAFCLSGAFYHVSAFTAMPIKGFVHKHHSCHQDQQTAGNHHQQSHGYSVCQQTEHDHADGQKAGVSCTK